MKFSLVHRVKYYLKDKSKDFDRRQKNASIFDKVFVGFIMLVLNVTFLGAGIMAIIWINNNKIFLDAFAGATMVGEIVQGFVVSAVSFLVSFCMSQLTHCEPWNSKKN